MPELTQNSSVASNANELEQANIVGLIQELIIAAQRAGLTPEIIGTLLNTTWESPGSSAGLTPDASGRLWYSDGLSQPDAQGLVSIRELEQLKASYEAAGKVFAANAIKSKFSCIAALAHIKDEKSQAAAAVITNTGYGRWMNAMNLAGGHLVFECIPNPALKQGNPDYPYNPFAAPFWIERRTKFNAKPIEDAYCIPDTAKTVSEAVAFVKSVAEQVQAFEDNRSNSGGFSPGNH